MACHSNLETHQTERAILTREAQRRTTRDLWSISPVICAAARIAESDWAGSASAGLEAELCLWYHLGERLEEFRNSDPTREDVRAYAANVREYLTYQLRIITANAPDLDELRERALEVRL